MSLVPGRVFVTIVAVTSLLGANLSASPESSGVEGVISVSPFKPGPLRKGEQSAAPAGNLEFIVRKDDNRVASFTTDASGRFQVSLPPGHYVIQREDPGAGPGHWRFEVDVVAGQLQKVNWTGDSGMR